MNESMLATKAAAAFLDLSTATLEAWRCRGGGPVFVKLGKAVRYRKSDLDAFLNSRTFANTSQVSSAVSAHGR